jgi:catechol 2,3-dioxygenase-like lactoylglutathione lyase family enzyme
MGRWTSLVPIWRPPSKSGPASDRWSRRDPATSPLRPPFAEQPRPECSSVNNGPLFGGRLVGHGKGRTPGAPLARPGGRLGRRGVAVGLSREREPAFPAQDDATVRAFHAAALAAGYEDHGGPGERAVYHPGYYGAFVLDPDGHNIEVVNHNR